MLNFNWRFRNSVKEHGYNWLEFFDENIRNALTRAVASGACNQSPKARGDTQWRYANKSALEIRSKINLKEKRRRDKDTTKYRSHEREHTEKKRRMRRRRKKKEKKKKDPKNRTPPSILVYARHVGARILYYIYFG